jgi:hypothetical protein
MANADEDVESSRAQSRNEIQWFKEVKVDLYLTFNVQVFLFDLHPQLLNHLLFLPSCFPMLLS